MAVIVIYIVRVPDAGTIVVAVVVVVIVVTNCWFCGAEFCVLIAALGYGFCGQKVFC